MEGTHIVKGPLLVEGDTMGGTLCEVPAALEFSGNYIMRNIVLIDPYNGSCDLNRPGLRNESDVLHSYFVIGRLVIPVPVCTVLFTGRKEQRGDQEDQDS